MSGILRSPGRAPLHATLGARASRLFALAAAGAMLAACGGVQIQPLPNLPQPLLSPMTARVGLVLDEELRRYVHEETRDGSNWKVDLGPGHEQFFRDVFGASFSSLEVFPTPQGARAASGLQGVFQPRIEQFSFATANETGGQYWAVTIRYRIAITGPAGDAIDALTLTGYGSARGSRSSSALTRATRAAMRDAGSKFLVQMPRQSLAQKLLAGEVLTAADREVVQVDLVETVPIEPEPAEAP